MAFNNATPTPDSLSFSDRLKQGIQNPMVLSWLTYFGHDVPNFDKPSRKQMMLTENDYFNPEASKYEVNLKGMTVSNSFEIWAWAKLGIDWEEVDKAIKNFSRQELIDMFANFVFEQMCLAVMQTEMNLGDYYFNSISRIPFRNVYIFIKALVRKLIERDKVEVTEDFFSKAVVGIYLSIMKENYITLEKDLSFDEEDAIEYGEYYVSDILKIQLSLFKKLMKLLDKTFDPMFPFEESSEDFDDLEI